MARPRNVPILRESGRTGQKARLGAGLTQFRRAGSARRISKTATRLAAAAKALGPGPDATPAWTNIGARLPQLSELLIHRGSDEAAVHFARQIAIACYQTAERLGSNPRTLADETQAALTQALTLGAGAR